jgi:hypothetical protein
MSGPSVVSVALKATPSYLYNNLVGSGNRMAYISRNEVHIVDVERAEVSSKCAYAEKANVLCTAFVVSGSSKSLLVCNASGMIFVSKN